MIFVKHPPLNEKQRDELLRDLREAVAMPNPYIVAGPGYDVKWIGPPQRFVSRIASRRRR